MTKMLRRVLVTLLPVLLVAQAVSAAETATTGRITGKVVDRSDGRPLAGANIVLIGTKRGAATDLDGRFIITNVTPGIYAVQASVIGYMPMVRSDVVVNTSRPVELTFSLSPSAVKLQDLKITAGYFQKETETKVSTSVQSNEEIRRLPGGFEDVVRAVSILPGVAQASPGRNDLVVRGGAPSENLYIIDNIEVPNINHFGTQGATGGPQSFINLDFVDRTTFSTGGFGVRYGDKLSSVLTLDLRDGRSDRIGGKGTISASQFGLNLEGPLPDGNGSFLVSARRSYLDFIFKAAGFAFVPEYWDFLGKVNYELGDRDRLTLLGVGALDNVRLFNTTLDQRYDNARVPASSQNTGVFGATWKHLFRNGFTSVTLGQSIFTFDTLQRDSLLAPVFRNRSNESESSLRADLVWKIADATELGLGLQQKLLRFDTDVYLRPFATSYGDTISVDQAYGTTTGKSAAYAQVSQGVGRLRLTLGGRVDDFTLIRDGLAFAPRFSATYALDMATNLNASLGRYYQAPSLIWLVANPDNRKLKPIGADQLVLGVDRLLRSDVRVSLEGYYKKYFDYPASTTRPYLVLANTGAGFGGAEDNFAAFGLDRLVPGGMGRARGVELNLQKKASSNPHYAIASLSYNETWFTALDGIERPGSYDQRWIFNLGGGFIFNSKWEASFRFRLATGRPYTPFESDGLQDPAKYNTARTPVNHSADVRVDRRWFFDSWTLITYVDVQNIYNNPYRDAPRWDERTGTAVVDPSIGILPTIGISVEF